MNALLLSAGYGTRLTPLTNFTPKCLAPINERPLLGYWLELLLPTYVEKVLINTHHLPEIVEDYIQKSEYSSLVITVFEDKLLGTAGTILRNRNFFSGSDFFVAHADNLTKFNVKDFQDAHNHRPNYVDITMMTFDTDEPSSCGIVVENSFGIVTQFFEKVRHPPSSKANAAVYIMSQNVIDFLASLNKEYIDISTDVIPHFLGKIQTFHNNQYHRDIGTPESLALANNEFIKY